MENLNAIVVLLKVQKFNEVIVSQIILGNISRLGLDNKTIKILLLSQLFLFVSIQCYSQKLKWIPFYWNSYQTKTRYFDKSAIMVDIKIDNLPYNFKMQFDLGADVTMIYKKTFANFKKESLKYKSRIDSVLNNGEKTPVYKNINLNTGSATFKNIDLYINENMGYSFNIDSIDLKKSISIGTIGADLFKGKFLIIDYPNSRIAVTDKLPKELSSLDFIKTKKLNDSRFFVPLLIDGKIQDLLFDTGTAMFPLVTSEKNAITISDTAIKDSLEISSWGKYYYTYGNQITKSIKMGNTDLPTGLVYYDKITKFDAWFENNNFWGIVGNAFFINNIVVIDYKNYRIAIK
jgi:hypothetical protein